MNTFERRLAARLLDVAAEYFSNRGCNDFEIDDSPEAREFVRAMEEWNGANEQEVLSVLRPRDGKLETMDWLVMQYLAHLLEES